MWAFSSCGEWALLSDGVAALTAVVSLVADHPISVWALAVSALGFRSCSLWALEHRLSRCSAQA